MNGENGLRKFSNCLQVVSDCDKITKKSAQVQRGDKGERTMKTRVLAVILAMLLLMTVLPAFAEGEPERFQ